MLLSKIVDAVNAKSFGETNWTYDDIYPYFAQAISEVNGELEDFRRIESAPDISESSPYYSIAAYNALPDTHLLNYIVTYITVAMDNAQLAVTSRTQSYATQLAKYKQQLIADLYKWMPLRDNSNVYFDLEHDGRDTRRLPVVGRCWYSEDEGGKLSCNPSSDGNYQTNPSLGVHCENPYGYLVPRDTTQKILKGTYYYDYIFVPYEAFRPYYDPVGVRVAITGYDILYTSIPYTTIEHLDVKHITNSSGDTISIDDNINMNNKTISNVNVNTPTLDTHPATKGYVDTANSNTKDYADTKDELIRNYVDTILGTKLDKSQIGYIELVGTSGGTLTDTQMLEVDKPYCIIKQTGSNTSNVATWYYKSQKYFNTGQIVFVQFKLNVNTGSNNVSNLGLSKITINENTNGWGFSSSNDFSTYSNTVIDNKITNLQSQIDGLNAGQNLADMVANLTALNNLDTTKLQANDKVQVLVDSDNDNASTVYKWNGTTWVYIGKYGQDSYTISETNTLLAGKQNVINANNKLPGEYVDLDIPTGAGFSITAEEIETYFEACDVGAEYNEDTLDLTNADFDENDDSILVLNADNVRVEGNTLVID